MKSINIRHPEIGVEDFLICYHKAYHRNNMKALQQLYDLYPEVARRAFDNLYICSHYDPADDESFFSHPITLNSTRMTERRVMDMVAYLFYQSTADQKYKEFLREKVSFYQVFTYRTARYQKIYDRNELWNNFFLAILELRHLIEKHRIADLTELEYRAANYFENDFYAPII